MYGNQSGNVLFLILIAVALFAALSYAVTSSTRSGDGNVDQEQIDLTTSQMVQYATDLRVALLRLNVSGVPAEDIQVNNGATYSVCESGEKCLFAAEGGGAIEQRIPDDFPDRYNDGRWRYLEVVQNTSIKDVGSSAPDILIFTSLNIDNEGEKYCRAINRQVGIDNIPGGPSGSGAPPWYDAAPGHTTACIRHYNTGYNVYSVLMER